MKTTKRIRRFILGIIGSLVAIWLCVGNAAPSLSETVRIDRAVSSFGDPSFAALMQQAESAATIAVTQAFSDRSGLAEVSVSVSGEHNGQEAPLLTATVSRTSWQQQPTITAWERRLSDAEYLLGFGDSSYAVAQAAPSIPQGLQSNIAPTYGDATYTDPRY